MRKSLIFFLKIGILVAAAVWLAQRPGRVTIEWLDHVAEMPVGIAAILVLLLAWIAATLGRLWRILRGGPGALGRRRNSNRREGGFRALSQGWVAVAAGDADIATKSAKAAEKLLREPSLTLPLAAHAAELRGDAPAAATYYKAMLAKPSTELAARKALLAQAMGKGDRPAALDHARRALELRPKADWPAKALAELEAGGGNWLEADAALVKAQKSKALAKEDAAPRRAALLIEEARQAVSTGRPESALQAAQAAFDLDPARVPAAALLARLLAKAGKHAKAGKVLEQTWRLSPHPDLAKAWGEVSADQNALSLVKRYEGLVALKPGAADAHFALGEAAINAKLWGVARSHLEKTRELAATQRVYRRLADVARAEKGEGPEAHGFLNQAMSAAADPRWRCTSCGTTHGDWHAVCDQCKSVDTITWPKVGR
ncbi:heme biosynthesis protein HemY [Niveispirillum sp. KHB5.9]|uniref:heme biosynthesis protein HemY n=1 Tax=Niveispirillum sp. KHB5.9 TaxID=3400269 RepID=UPI003A8532C0